VVAAEAGRAKAAMPAEASPEAMKNRRRHGLGIPRAKILL